MDTDFSKITPCGGIAGTASISKAAYARAACKTAGNASICGKTAVGSLSAAKSIM